MSVSTSKPSGDWSVWKWSCVEKLVRSVPSERGPPPLMPFVLLCFLPWGVRGVVGWGGLKVVGRVCMR